MRLDTEKAKEVAGKVPEALRGNRLWPLAIVLLVAIVAVPIALSKSSSAPPVAAAPPVTLPASPGTSIPALNVQASGVVSRLPGHGRDPFAGLASGTGSAASAGTTALTTTGATAGAGAGAASGTTSGSGSSPAPTGAAPTTVPVTPQPLTPTAKPKPVTPGLTSTQAYDVSLEITNSSGGLDSIDPLQRLSVLPSQRQPLLVELGVLKGGSRVLFAVQPGAVLGGPGRCTPGPIDCEILSLGQDQTEAVGVKSSGAQTWSTLFEVGGISAVNYPSAAAADRARRAESAAGRAILDASTATSLSLFRYDPSVGAVIDLRNLTVGEN